MGSGRWVNPGASIRFIYSPVRGHTLTNMDYFDRLDLNALHMIALAYWLALTFVFGAAIGSFVNVAAARLPLEKSLIWPGSRCGRCLQPVPWYDNLPLASHLWLPRRCRS